ncbi:Plasminogen activator inhibitor 2, macrophage, partial [Stegodyphus mimosarum]
MNITMVHEAFGQINKDIILPDALETANGLFIQRGFSVSRSYEDALQHFYSTHLTEVDFRNALIEVNSWVQQRTRGKISVLLDKNLSHSTKMMMVNAAYFRSRWKWEFDPRATEPNGYFYLTPRRRVQVPIMSGKMNVAIGHDFSVGASILELPFTPTRVSMFLVLPDNPELHFHFNVTSMKLLIGSMKKRDVNVRLPRFSLDQIPQMTDLLWKLGIQDIFSPTEADLGGIAKGLFVTDVMQRAVLKVDEEGSIASAATVTLVERIGNVDDHYFEANRPFIFMVMDKKTGAVLFMGRMANF